MRLPSRLRPLASGFTRLRPPQSQRPPPRRPALEVLEARDVPSAVQDFLFVGDNGTAPSTVNRYDAATGSYQGQLVQKSTSTLNGAMGMVVDGGDLLVVNQNIGLPVNGDVRRFDAATGALK